MVRAQPAQDEPIRMIDLAFAAITMTVSVFLVGIGIVAWWTVTPEQQLRAGEWAPLHNLILLIAFGFGLPTGLASLGIFRRHPAGYVCLGLIMLVSAVMATFVGGFVLVVPLGLAAAYFLWRFVDILKTNYASSTR